MKKFCEVDTKSLRLRALTLQMFYLINQTCTTQQDCLLCLIITADFPTIQ